MAREEVVRALDLGVGDLDALLLVQLVDQVRRVLGRRDRSAVPLMIRPEDGQGARKLKSYMLAGGATETKPVISGRRIRSCMPIQAPKEKPATQQCLAFWFIACR
jgi:hypothetical protein